MYPVDIKSYFIFLGVIYLVSEAAAAVDNELVDANRAHEQPGKIRHHQKLNSNLAHSVNKTETFSQDGDHQRRERLEKRYLNWEGNQIISTTKEPVTVKYFRPHERSERVNIEEDYLGFTLYKRNGEEVEANTGIFHFVKSSDSEREGRQCPRPTRHAGAYRYIYGRCPEDDFDVVASGYCHRVGGRLVYNSNTFNDHLSYADGSYYASSGRVMNSIEITYFSACFNDWKDGGYELSFKCPVSPTFRLSSVEYQSNNTMYYSALSNDICGGCEQDCNRNTRLIVSCTVVITTLVFEMLLIMG